jgi:tripartite-type tricarboxylate transporter receptor subunit TctC
MLAFPPRARLRLLALTGALLLAPVAYAQAWPARPIKLVVPFSAGGAADLLGRAVAERMARGLGQPIVVENKPGAGTVIAADYVAKSPADGYTVLLAGTTTLVLNPLLSSKLPYDTQRDFTGAAMLASSPMVMVVNARNPAASAQDFVRAAKAKPGALNFGSAGNGSSLQLAGELFKTMADIEMTHVPFKGSPPALQALVADDVQVLFDLVMTAKPLIDGGKLKPLAVTGDTRSAVLPNVPTLQELGFKGYDAAPRYALVVPKDTPRAVVDRLNAEANAALRDRTLAAQMANVAMDVQPGPPEAVGEFIARERTRWSSIITARNIRLDP